MSVGIIYIIGFSVTLMILAVTAGYVGAEGLCKLFDAPDLQAAAVACAFTAALWPFPATLAVCSIPYFIGKAARKYRDRPRVPKARAL